MAKLNRAAATRRCFENLTGLAAANDVIDVRKQKINFQLYVCRIIDDSCIFVIANNVEECKNYLKKAIGGIEYTMADSTTWPAPYTNMQCWAGIAITKTKIYLTVHKITDDIPFMNDISLKDYVRNVLAPNA